jgi:hypothetical protein
MKRLYVLISYNLKIYTDQTNNSLIQKEKNQCPREGMFSDSFAKARGRDEG